MSKIISLEEAGWKRIYPLNTPNINSHAIKTLLGETYNLVEDDRFLLCEPLQKRSLIKLNGVITKENSKEWQNIIESQINLYNNKLALQHHSTDIKNPADFVKDFLNENPLTSAYLLRNLLALSRPENLKSILKALVTPIFDRHPNRALIFIDCDNLLHRMKSSIRMMSAFDIFPEQEIKTLFEDGIIPQVMSKAHKGSFDEIFEASICSILCSFFPYLYGDLIRRIGGYIVVIYDTPLVVEPMKDKDRYDFLRASKVFGEPGSLPMNELFEKAKSQNTDYELAFSQYIHKKIFSPNEIKKLILWAVEQVNAIYSSVFDLCRFSNANNFIDFGFIRKFSLTLERIFIEINSILLEREQYVRKSLYFNLHDKIASLMSKPGDIKDRKTTFNRLLKHSHFKNILSNKLERLPPPFDNYIKDLGNIIFKNIIDFILVHTWHKKRISSKGVLLREKLKGNSDSWLGNKFQDMNNKIEQEQYVVNILHELRNTLHGYVLSDDNFEHYLGLYEGPIPDYLSDLSTVWLFLLLADIDGLISKDWKICN